MPPKKLKIVFLGMPAVGKTSIINRYMRNLFANRYINTLGCDFYVKNMTIQDDTTFKLIIHDIGGQVEFRTARRKYMARADIVFIVFALDAPASYEIGEFLKDVLDMEETPLFSFVGNKLDLVNPDSLDLSSIKNLASKYNTEMFLTSAKENVMIREIFVKMVEQFSDISNQ